MIREPIAVPAGMGGAPAAPGDAVNFLPPGYVPGMSPYLPAPASGTAPLHRTPRFAVIPIVGVVIAVIGSAGGVLAGLHTGGTAATSSVAAPANVPPAATAPAQPPSSTPMTATAGRIITTHFAAVFVPSDFTVSDQGSDYIVLTPNSGDGEAVGLQSEPLKETKTNAALDQDLLASDQQNGDPSARFCTATAPTHAQLTGSGGVITGDVISICERVTPASGPALAAVDGFIDAVARASDGSLEAIWVEILAPKNNFQSFANSLPSALFSQTTFTDASPLS
jgi:hypothetical protein